MKTFVDRTDAVNKAEPMRKLLVISNACLYWNASETRMIAQMAEEHKMRILNGMILKEGAETTSEPVDFLFKISSQISLTMNNKGNFDVPEIKVETCKKYKGKEGKGINFIVLIKLSTSFLDFTAQHFLL